jgi:hypothetical protein
MLRGPYGGAGCPARDAASPAAVRFLLTRVGGRCGEGTIRRAGLPLHFSLFPIFNTKSENPGRRNKIRERGKKKGEGNDFTAHQSRAEIVIVSSGRSAQAQGRSIDNGDGAASCGVQNVPRACAPDGSPVDAVS